MKIQNLKNQTSKGLMAAAWIFEITFCFIGLLIAFTLSTSHLEIISITTITSPDIFIGLLVLGAVAFVELCKIPLVQGFFLVDTLKAKALTGMFLALACLLTFESMSTGLEQNFTNREKGINDSRFEVVHINESITNLSREIRDIEQTSMEDIYASYKNKLEESLAPITDQIKEYRKRELQLSSLKETPESKEFRRQIESIEKSRKAEMSSHDQAQARLDGELLKLNSDEQTELSGAFFKTSITERYHERREAIKSEKKLLTNEYKKQDKIYKNKIAELNLKLSEFISPTEDLLKEKSLISKTILELQADKQEVIEKSNLALDKELLKAEESKSLISQKKNLLNEYSAELLTARKQLSEASENYYLHRIAANWYDLPSTADLTSSQASKVTYFVIISLAALIATIGPVLTYISLRLKLDTSKKKRKLHNSLRRTLLTIRKRLQEPKIVTEIKEVEKEVEKIVEVEIEKKVYETVEVPTVVEVEKKVYETVEVPTPYEVQKFISVPVPTELKDLPFANNVSSINDKKVYLGGAK